MNRTTKKVLSLAVSAAMVFSVSFSAFAEQATPETAVALIADDNQPVAVLADENSNEAMPQAEAVAQDAEGNTYATVQEAMNANKGKVTLLKDTTESVNATSSLDFNGHTLTAADGDNYAIHIAGNQIQLTATNGGGTVGGVQSDSWCTIKGGTYKAKDGGYVLESKEEGFQIYGGTFIGSDTAPVVYASGNPGTTNAVFLDASVEVRAGAGQPIFAHAAEAEEYKAGFNAGTFYGELGVSDPKHVSILGGNFDHEPPANCLGQENYPVKVEKQGDFWVVSRDMSAYVATVNGMNYTSLNAAMKAAVKTISYNYCTVTLLKDTTENVSLQYVPQGEYASTPKTITLNLDGHTLSAADPDQPVIKLDGVPMMLDGKKEAAQAAGTVNGTIEATDYLWIVHTTVNAPAGHPAINYTGTEDNNLSIKGRSVINGAAGQSVVVANAEVHIGDDTTLRAGTNDVLFAKSENAASEKYFFLDMTTLYGNLGDEATLKGVTVNISGGKSWTKFDRMPSNIIVPEGFMSVKNGDLYELQPASAKEVVSDDQKVESTVDTNKTAAPAVDEKVPENLKPTQEAAAKKAEEIKNELTDTANISTAVKDFKDNNLTGAVKIDALPNVTADSTVTLYVAVELQDIQLGADVKTDDKGTVTEVKLASKTLRFDVTPMAQVDSHDAAKIDNSNLNGSYITFRLPIPADVTEKYAAVTHEGDPTRYIEILTGEDGKKYIEISATHFSVFEVNFTNTLPAANNGGETAAEPEATPAPAATPAPVQKNDGSVYYTCTACGYHDWTATAEGYKCNHCGHIESVKQLAGYNNVKGVYEPKTSTAAAQKTAAKAKTMSAIPQTSDEMPITALVVVAIAAMLGFGITVVAKRKHEQ